MVLQTRHAIDQVQHLSQATLLVRRSSATQKMMLDALKTCRLMEREQFELKQDAAEAHLRTQRCAGELLLEQAKHPGGRPVTVSTPEEVRNDTPPTLHDLGIDPHESHRWQRIAGIPAKQFEDFISQTREADRELTVSAAIRYASQLIDASGNGKTQNAVGSRGDMTARGEYYKNRLAIQDMVQIDPRALVVDLRRAECQRVFTEMSQWHRWLTEFLDALRRRAVR
jgi:hypothetical protein